METTDTEFALNPQKLKFNPFVVALFFGGAILLK